MQRNHPHPQPASACSGSPAMPIVGLDHAPLRSPPHGLVTSSPPNISSMLGHPQQLPAQASSAILHAPLPASALAPSTSYSSFWQQYQPHQSSPLSQQATYRPQTTFTPPPLSAPLSDMTTRTPNSPRKDSGPSRKRKADGEPAGTPSRSRKRPPVVGREPALVGTGPIEPPLPVVAVPALSMVAVNPNQGRTDGATDVWYFLIPVNTASGSPPLYYSVPAEDEAIQDSDSIDIPDKYAYMICRLCWCVCGFVLSLDTHSYRIVGSAISGVHGRPTVAPEMQYGLISRRNISLSGLKL
jgi:hypothetical protein